MAPPAGRSPDRAVPAVGTVSRRDQRRNGGFDLGADHARSTPALSAMTLPPVTGRDRADQREAVWRSLGRPGVTALLCAAAVVLVRLIDASLASRRWPIPVEAVQDEPAHLLTAALVLAAVLPGRARALAPWALAGAVLIDVDHIPLYLWGWLVVDGEGRPVTHSLATVLALALAGVLAGSLARGRLRTALLGLSAGVALHLVRDVPLGPGAPLFWPLSPDGVVAPYWGYVTVLVTAAAVAVARRLWARSRTDG
jgi:inner membrane protein